MTIRHAHTGDIDIAFETFGSADDPTLLLVMGLATQMIAWADSFCTLLADEGFHVVRFDNRDVGLSTHLEHAGVPDLSPLLEGDLMTESSYLLGDMADDSIGVLDALDVDAAHVVGASMGGMIAQEIAIRHSERILSLTSIMSTTAPWIGAPQPHAAQALLSPGPTTEDEAAARTISVYRVIGSPGYPLDESALDSRGREAFRRANDPAGAARQLAAIHVSGDRTAALGAVAVPTLVLHGEDDPLVGVEGGRATAAAVPGARLVTFPGMGHDLPEALWAPMVADISSHARAAQS